MQRNKYKCSFELGEPVRVRHLTNELMSRHMLNKTGRVIAFDTSDAECLIKLDESVFHLGNHVTYIWVPQLDLQSEPDGYLSQLVKDWPGHFEVLENAWQFLRTASGADTEKAIAKANAVLVAIQEMLDILKAHQRPEVQTAPEQPKK